MARASGILGVDHVAVVTSRVEEAEKHYAELFEAHVLFRGATQRGIWVTIDGEEDWTEIRRHGIRIEGSFLRAGGLTISVLDEPPPAKTGPINHVGLGCSDAEVRTIKERVKRAGLRIVDNLSMQLVKRPQEYDVLLLPNLYGDIISDLCAGLIGGLGIAPGANLGDEVAVFEATHGSAPKYKGQNKVNPMAMMFSGVLMLRHLAENAAADALEGALAAVIKEGKSVTYDLKERRDDPTAVGTSQVADAVIEKLNG